MGGEMLEMGVKIRKVMVFTIKRCFRSVRNHPFLVGMLCFLVFLYRSSPFLFSLLVSASPVLVCTAVLLGTLLSFGQPNIPEIERDEKITYEISSLKTEISGDATLVKKNESYSLERVTHRGGVMQEQLNEEPYSATNRTSELHESDISDSSYLLMEDRSLNLKFESEINAEGRRQLHDLEYGRKNEVHDERRGDKEPKTDDEDLEFENDKSPAESFDSEMVNVDSLDSPPASPWKHVAGEEKEEKEEKDDDDDEEVDSGSDGAESSSPDASMADIIPMLDELHPLLDEHAPQPASLSHDGSDAASEHTAKSSESSSELDDDIKKHERLEVADEENEDADDEDEAHGSKEGHTKSAITWTEEDQKNLMDLGSSELERNQRLESLIARRRARKTMSMMPERNLIDLEGVDLSFHIPPISTARNNPFDIPHDSYDNMGLPPIPGSAPSVLLKRQNPFDLPYDSSEEKPDLMGDSFQQEFTSSQPKEPFFRRHESFNVGPSVYGLSRQDMRLRPYFVLERMDSEGTSYSTFQRQSSGLSESKGSSVPDTDSVVSVGDVEDKNDMEENISLLAGALNSVPEIELGGPAGDLEDKNLSEENIPEEPELVLKKEDKNLSKEDSSQETELISTLEHVSEHVGHGSQSSEEADLLELDEAVKRDIDADELNIGLQDAKNKHEIERIVFEEGGGANIVELNSTETHLNVEFFKHGYTNASSSSSLSEVSERIFSETEAEGVTNLEERRHDPIEEAGISTQHSPERLDLDTANALAGGPSHKEPVYDSSPPAVQKNLSSSSMSSDLHIESEMALPPVLIKRTVSFAERDSDSDGLVIEKNASENEDTSAYTSLPDPVNDQSESRTEADISRRHVTQFDLSKVDQLTNSNNALAVPESIVHHDSIDTRSSLDHSILGDKMSQPDGHDYLESQVSSSANADAQVSVHGVLHQTVESVANFSVNHSLAQSKEQVHSQAAEQVLVHNASSAETLSTVERSVDKEVAFLSDQGAPASNSSTNSDAGVFVKPEDKHISVHNQSSSEGKSISEFNEELVFLDKTVDETSSRQEMQEPSVILKEITGESIYGDNLNASRVQELDHVVSSNIHSPTSPESIYIPSEAYESRVAEGYSDGENYSSEAFENASQFQVLEAGKFLEEANNSPVDVQTVEDVEDEMKEIDEVLLSELDTVGDFRIEELGSGVNAHEKHVVSDGEGSSFPHIGMRSSTAVVGDSIELHESNFILHSEKASSSEMVAVDTHGEEVKFASEPQASGRRAIEHTVSVGDSIEEVESSGDIGLTETTALPRENEIVVANSAAVQNSNLDTNTEMTVVEARSIGDIESIVKKHELTSTGTATKLDRSEMPHQDEVSEAANSGMPVVESQTLRDIDSAFKLIRVEEIEKPNVGEPPHVEETVASAPGSVEPTTQPGSHVVDAKPPSMFPVMETRSLEYVNVAANQVSECHQEKVPDLISLDRSAEVGTNDAGTCNDMQLNDKEVDVKEMSRSADENLDAEVEKPETLTTSDVKVKGKKSHKARSSSSSSSSLDSSSSDSDKEGK